LSGPAYQIEGLDKDFDEFLKSLKLSEQNQLTWTVPANWKELPGNANRLVTFKKTHNGAEHELYISTPFGGTNLENINRWRVQFVGLTAVDELGLPSVTTTFKIGNVTALKVDMVGPGPKGNPRGMMR
jgi:hypothetical protein